ncbi:GMC family oxidoreductase N-terminal domain-containing protein [Streptomyces sp. NPDC006510]|uniref:GMC family oxidoreductase n=1 Tax=Streptomyces sp. NPDC006510 TaxID=3155600 RepID=UPI0033AA142F
MPRLEPARTTAARTAGLPDHAEIVVLGGGTAGCVVAGRLAERHQVLLLEAGPDYGPDYAAWPADLLDATTLPASHDWGYQGAGLTFERCRVIGGCSTHNGCTQSAGWAGDYDAWAAAGLTGWDSASLSPLFDQAAKKLRFRTYREDEVQPFQRDFIAAGAALGLPVRHDFDQLDGGLGIGCAPVNITPGGVRFNTAFGYLDPVRDNGNLTVIGGVKADRVILDHGRAVGVEVRTEDGARHRIDASLVVVSAGAYGSPEVMLRSGIGPAEHLAEVGVSLSHHLPGVGENLHDHPSVHLEFAATEQLAADLNEFSRTRLLPDEQAIAKLRSPYAGAAAPYDLHVYPWVERDATLPHGWRCFLPVGLLNPRSRGTVRLRSADPDALAAVDHAYLSHPDDLAALVHGVTWVRQLELSHYLGTQLLTPDEDLPAWIKAHHQHYWHPAGSCRMGPDGDPGAVVDHTGKVHGLDGLYLADASIFPDVPRATPALPTTVVGERIAAFLQETL